MSANLKLEIRLINKDKFQLRITNSRSMLSKKQERQIRTWLHLEIIKMLRGIDPNMEIRGTK